MATQLWVNGPVGIFTGTGASNAIEFLGYTEGDLRLTLDAAFDDVHTDLAGPRIPADVIYMGEQAFASGTITQYDEAVWARIADRLRLATRGTIDANTIGTLMLTEGKTFELIIDAPYQAKTAYTSMQPCFDFPTAYLADATDYDLGTKVKKIHFLFRAIASMVSSTGAGTLFNTTRPTLPART